MCVWFRSAGFSGWARAITLESAFGNRGVTFETYGFETYLSKESGDDINVLLYFSRIVFAFIRPSLASFTLPSDTNVRSHNIPSSSIRHYFVQIQIKLNWSSCRYNEEHCANPLAPLMTRPTSFPLSRTSVRCNWTSYNEGHYAFNVVSHWIEGFTFYLITQVSKYRYRPEVLKMPKRPLSDPAEITLSHISCIFDWIFFFLIINRLSLILSDPHSEHHKFLPASDFGSVSTYVF